MMKMATHKRNINLSEMENPLTGMLTRTTILINKPLCFPGNALSLFPFVKWLRLSHLWPWKSRGLIFIYRHKKSLCVDSALVKYFPRP